MTDLWLSELDRIISDIDQNKNICLFGKLEADRNNALRNYIYALRDLNCENHFSMEQENEAAIDAAQMAVTKKFNELISAQHRCDRWSEARERFEELIEQ